MVGNNVGDEGAIEIGKALISNTTLTVLNLECSDTYLKQ